jgi:hypothetical protein
VQAVNVVVQVAMPQVFAPHVVVVQKLRVPGQSAVELHVRAHPAPPQQTNPVLHTSCVPTPVHDAPSLPQLPLSEHVFPPLAQRSPVPKHVQPSFCALHTAVVPHDEQLGVHFFIPFVVAVHVRVYFR